MARPKKTNEEGNDTEVSVSKPKSSPLKNLATIDQIIKDHGNVVYDGERLIDNTGILIPVTLSLDIALNGGILEGTITSMATPAKVGKTTIMLEFVKNAQRLSKPKHCFYFDVEGRVQTSLLSCIEGLVWTQEQEEATGIPRLRIIKSEAGNILTAEKFLAIATKLIRDVPGCVIIVDSIAALCTEDNFTKDIVTESPKMADLQKLLYQFFRTVNQTLPITKASIVCITHLQANPGSYNPMPKSYGGVGLEYFASNIIKSFSAGKEVPEGKGEKTGKDTTFKVIASATGGPASEANVYIVYGKGCNKYKDATENAVKYGFVSRTGAWYELTPSEGDKIKLQGQDAVEEYLRANPKEYLHLVNQIREAVIPNAIRLTSP